MKKMKRLMRQKNRGSALVIALVILMVMTLIGITSMNTSIMEERMAGSMFNRNFGFQAAESALRQGEAWIASQSVLPDLCSCYLKDTDTCACFGTDRIWDIRAADPDVDNNNSAWWDEAEWNASDPNSWWCTDETNPSDCKAVAIATSSSDAEWITGVASQPAYVIEELPPFPESLEVGKSVDDNDIYLQVTARGVGGTSSSVVLLQSTYKW